MTDATSEAGSRGEILIVDDNPTNLDLLAGLLRPAGFLVRVANSGRRALSIAGSFRPDAILLDVDMPELDGYEVCRRLAAHPATRDIPVIFVSALDTPLDKVAAFDAGGVDYLTKPFHFAEVLVRLEHQLRLARLTREITLAAAELRTANEALRQTSAELAAKNQQLAAANARLEALSYRDSLTGIANRRSFEETLASLWTTRDESPLVLIMLDLDHFKGLNDRHGHQHGDECLARVGAALARFANEHSGLAARVGGEELALLLPGQPAASTAARLAEGTRLAIFELALSHLGSPWQVVTASVGVAVSSPETATPDALIAAADAALYTAKRAGRNRVACG